MRSINWLRHGQQRHSVVTLHQLTRAVGECMHQTSAGRCALHRILLMSCIDRCMCVYRCVMHSPPRSFLYTCHFGICGRLEPPVERLDHVQRKARDSDNDRHLDGESASEDKGQVCESV